MGAKINCMVDIERCSAPKTSTQPLLKRRQRPGSLAVDILAFYDVLKTSDAVAEHGIVRHQSETWKGGTTGGWEDGPANPVCPWWAYGGAADGVWNHKLNGISGSDLTSRYPQNSVIESCG